MGNPQCSLDKLRNNKISIRFSVRIAGGVKSMNVFNNRNAEIQKNAKTLNVS